MNNYSKLLVDIGYDFKNYKLLKRALTHSSFDYNEKNYEKLIDQTADEISNFIEKANLKELS